MTLPDLAESYRILTSEPSAVRMPRDLVRVAGPDAIAYLQGQVSQDVAALGEDESAWSLILQPQGKVDAWFRITRLSSEDRTTEGDAEDVDPEFGIDLDAGFAHVLIDRLNRFKLRTKVDIDHVPGDMVSVRTHGQSLNFVATSSQTTSEGPTLPSFSAAPFFGVGIDLLGEGQSIPEGLTEVSPAAYEVARIEAGMPRMGAELTADTIPAASGVVDLSASFTKGCYTGQELVARVDSRGNNTPTHLRVLRTEGELAVGDMLGDGQGTVTSAAEHPDGGSVGLGYVKRSVEVPASLPGANGDVAIAPVPSAATTTD